MILSSPILLAVIRLHSKRTLSSSCIALISPLPRTRRPLPDESRANKASDLIKKFQSQITSDDAPLSVKSSFGAGAPVSGGSGKGRVSGVFKGAEGVESVAKGNGVKKEGVEGRRGSETGNGAKEETKNEEKMVTESPKAALLSSFPSSSDEPNPSNSPPSPSKSPLLHAIVTKPTLPTSSPPPPIPSPTPRSPGPVEGLSAPNSPLILAEEGKLAVETGGGKDVEDRRGLDSPPPPNRLNEKEDENVGEITPTPTTTTTEGQGLGVTFPSSSEDATSSPSDRTTSTSPTRQRQQSLFTPTASSLAKTKAKTSSSPARGSTPTKSPSTSPKIGNTSPRISKISPASPDRTKVTSPKTTTTSPKTTSTTSTPLKTKPSSSSSSSTSPTSSSRARAASSVSTTSASSSTPTIAKVPATPASTKSALGRSTNKTSPTATKGVKEMTPQERREMAKAKANELSASRRDNLKAKGKVGVVLPKGGVPAVVAKKDEKKEKGVASESKPESKSEAKKEEPPTQETPQPHSRQPSDVDDIPSIPDGSSSETEETETEFLPVGEAPGEENGEEKIFGGFGAHPVGMVGTLRETDILDEGEVAKAKEEQGIEE